MIESDCIWAPGERTSLLQPAKTPACSMCVFAQSAQIRTRVDGHAVVKHGGALHTP